LPVVNPICGQQYKSQRLRGNKKMVVVADTAYKTYACNFYPNQDNKMKLAVEIRTSELGKIHNSGHYYLKKLVSEH
jgi:hypothetical protein